MIKELKRYNEIFTKEKIKNTLIYENILTIKQKEKMDFTGYYKHKFYAFIIIKSKNKIIKCILKDIYFNQEFDSLINDIKRTTLNLEEENYKKIEINYSILKNDSSNKTNITNLLKIFSVLLEKLEKRNNNETIYSKMTNLLFFKTYHIFIILTLILTITVINELNMIGLSLNLLSIETISIVTNIIILNLAKVLFIVFILIFISTLTIRYILYKTQSNIRHKLQKRFLLFVKSAINIMMVFYIFLIINDLFKLTNFNLTSIISTKYIKMNRIPTLINIKNITTNKEEVILLMNKDSDSIYYLTAKQIDKHIIKNNNMFCKSIKKSYFQDLISLLKLKNKDNTYAIANARYLRSKISNIEYQSKFSNINDTFCKNLN